MSSNPLDFGDKESVALRMRLKAIQEEIVQEFKSLSPEVQAVTSRLHPVEERINAAVRKEMRRTAAEFHAGWNENMHIPFWIQSAGYYLDMPDYSALVGSKPASTNPNMNAQASKPSLVQRLLARWRNR